MPTEFRLVRYNARPTNAGEGLLDTTDLARAAGMHPDLVRRIYCLGALEATSEWSGEPLFPPATVLRLRRMARLRRDLGVTWQDLGLVSDLLERIFILEARVRELEKK